MFVVMKNLNENQFLALLRVGVFFVFLGRAWQFIFWDAPYRALLWDQRLMEPIINEFGVKWGDWVTSMSVDAGIQLSIRITGWVFLLCALLTFVYTAQRKWIKIPLWVGSFFLLVLAILQTKEKFYHIGQFLEHASQVGAPIVLIGFVSGWLKHNKLAFYIKTLVALTFFCHGLYAINYYPRPGVFVDLMINTFGVSEPFAHQFIFIAGVIDLVLAVLLFIPKIDTAALWYAAFWGLVTALSRAIAGFYWDFPWDSLHQVWHTSAYRLIHGLLPLALLVYIKPISIYLKRRKSALSVSNHTA